MVNRVIVLGGDNYAAPWRDTYPRADIQVTNGKLGSINLDGVDAIQFTGGSDVTAWLYGETPQFQSDHQRDLHEVCVHISAIVRNIPCFGICRGSQFLYVMCGGKLHQDIPGHAIHGRHKARINHTIVSGPSEFEVTSTHHQAADATLLAGTDEVRLLLGGTNDGHNAIEGWMCHALRTYAVQYHPEYMESESYGFRFYQDLIRFGCGDVPIMWQFNP